MGYYANGKGSISFKETLPEALFQEIAGCITSVMECDGCRKWTDKKAGKTYSSFDIWDNEKYYGDEVEEMLNKVASLAPIEEGELAYLGEDDCLWRFIYGDGVWHEENGEVCYPVGSLSYDRLLSILQSYVGNDAEATAEREYPKDALYNAGCSDDDIRALGFDWLLDE